MRPHVVIEFHLGGTQLRHLYVHALKDSHATLLLADSVGCDLPFDLPTYTLGLLLELGHQFLVPHSRSLDTVLDRVIDQRLNLTKFFPHSQRSLEQTHRSFLSPWVSVSQFTHEVVREFLRALHYVLLELSDLRTLKVWLFSDCLPSYLGLAPCFLSEHIVTKL